VVLLRKAGQKSRHVGVSLSYARILVEDPGCLRSWAQIARAFALRFDWTNCRIAVRKAMARDPEPASTRLVLSCLNLMAEQSQLGELRWKDWFASLSPEIQASPEAVGLLTQTGDLRASSAVTQMLEQGFDQDDVHSCLIASMGIARQGDLPRAYGYLERAFELDLPLTLRAVVMRYSAQTARILSGSGKLDAIAHWLTEQSSDPVTFTAMPRNLAAGTARSTLKRREKALSRGLPSPILIAQGKSASVSVANIFMSGFGLATVLYSLVNQRVIAPWLDDYLRGGACYTTHLFPYPENVTLLGAGAAKPIIVHVRDPRQQVVSLMEHYRRYPNQRDAALQASSVDDSESFDQIIDLRLRGQIRWIGGWVDAEEQLGIKFTTFEEFVTDRPRFLERILSHYGGDTRYFDRRAAGFESPNVDYHRRKGEVDEWRTRLSPQQVHKINAAIPAAWWEKFGWRP